MLQIASRCYERSHAQQLIDSGIHPILARIYAARGISHTTQLEDGFSLLQPAGLLKNIDQAAAFLADAIAAQKKIIVIADYDSDGATACAVAVRALNEFGAKVSYIVPNRFEYGYGLTPEIVTLASSHRPDILITVDNGMGSVAGVEEANSRNIQVLITDHHLPGSQLPRASCIVNPNQPGCGFPSKHLAGVGVIFYVMLALRAYLREQGTYRKEVEPNLAKLLDLVALGTVADVVRLDDNNRVLVNQGLKRIRAGKACHGINALLQVAGRRFTHISSYDLGFILGPRLNAAGRLDDMALGIECLTTHDMEHALHIARQLDELNRERRSIEANMHHQALLSLDHFNADESYTLCVSDPSWHQGIVGILASRLKDKLHRPVIAFAPGNADELKGSGRSITGLHLRDALDLVSKRHPGLIEKFGGHAYAAGLTIRKDRFSLFANAFEEVTRTLLSPSDLKKVIETDGTLSAPDLTLELASHIERQIWGQGFPEPVFSGSFDVKSQKIVGEKHIRLRLKLEDQLVDAMLFFHNEPLPSRIHAAYHLNINEYNGNHSLQLTIRHWEPG